MITLHHLEYSQSFRVLWLLEELAIDYELKKYNRDPKTKLAPDDYKALSPLGTAPVITDGDVVLAETNAILEYILDQHPNPSLRPSIDSTDRAQHLFWLHASQGSMMPLLLMDLIFGVSKDRAPLPFKFFLSPVIKGVRSSFIKPRMIKLLSKAEQDLANSPWFGGHELTIADIAMVYSIEAAKSRGWLSAQYTHCHEWLNRVEQRAAFQSAKEKDGRPSMVPTL